MLNFAVDNQNCTSNEVKSDQDIFIILNCEIIVKHDIYFFTLYVGDEDILGGVTEKKEYDQWLGLRNKGFLINRWLTFSY